MSRTIELGRAVLSTSTTNHELWLRTLITISPQHENINLKQYDAASLLDLLSSGEVWVGREHGFHLDMKVTFAGQPLAGEQLESLSKAILGAPVWDQLKLQPSLPYDTVLGPVKLRIDLSHSTNLAQRTAKQHHRILLDVSPTDVRPPPGISTLGLGSVSFYMDIFELIRPGRSMTAKRQRISVNDGSALSATSQVVNDLEEENAEDLLLELDDTETLQTATLKRSIASSKAPSSSASLPRNVASGHQLPVFHSTAHMAPSKLEKAFEDESLRQLIDGALRLSVTGVLRNKSMPGTKIKANTFRTGLGQIAPALWRPGYMLSFSQRANLLPTICRSLDKTAASPAVLMSLKDKLSALTQRPAVLRSANETGDQIPAAASSNTSIDSGVATQLWLHLQKTLRKSATPLQSFMAAGSLSQTHSQFDDMLEPPPQGDFVNNTFRPSTVSLEGSGASGIAQVLYHRPATPSTWSHLPSEQHVLRAEAGGCPPADVNDDLLLGGESFEPLLPVTLCSDENP